MSTIPHLVIAGGGAAGFFAALAVKAVNRALPVTVLETADRVLRKVTVSGGGRCNVTHACFEPAALARFYPRGHRELRGAFHKFQPRDTVAWFAARGVPLKTEADGRIFPVSDRAQSIVACLTREAARLGVTVRTNTGLQAARRQPDGRFALALAGGARLTADRLLLACGGTRAGNGAQLAQTLGHAPIPPVPSLFSFRVRDEHWCEHWQPLAGVSKAPVTVSAGDWRQTGAVLITHEGLSGPAILQLSAWGARRFAAQNYHFTVSVDWTAGAGARAQFLRCRQHAGQRRLGSDPQFAIPQRLWARLLTSAAIPADRRWRELRKGEAAALTRTLTVSQFQVAGQSLHRGELVTCGGIPTREVDFRTMASKLCAGLYFAGEMLDIDGVTGGFNFQNAWTTGWLAGTDMAAI
ncbi:MAG: NAD(P)/FAD-dependent oxidoreductase [Verrucomicrobiales bacterium]|jgi:predicted Rossmann fold flavoprotein|nr:NAD(P)/FAD-dependent oxidoreductase [Verrucomicrobiales bacterium]